MSTIHKLRVVTLLASLAWLGGEASATPLYLIDFGGAGLSTQPTYGAVPTTSPDVNGNHWNNSQGGPGGAPSNLTGLVSTTNQASTISLTWTSSGGGVATANMGVSPVPTGSALASSPLNITTAVADSVFRSTAGTNSFRIAGLTPSSNYNFSIFASRTSTNTRFTDFTVVGATTLTQSVQTSGTDLAGPGNNYSVTPWDFTLAADTNGEVRVDMALGTGGFAYINAMSIAVVPEPSNLMLVVAGVIGAVGLTLRRRTA